MNGADVLALEPGSVRGDFSSKRGETAGDEAARDLAHWFATGSGSPPIPAADALDLAHLDYSVESLALVDTYLETVRERVPPGSTLSREHVALVMRVGSYVGEVIRRGSLPERFRWLDEDELLRDFSDTFREADEYGLALGESLVLYENGMFWFPLEKIRKFLRHGRIESTESFTRLAMDPGHFGMVDKPGSHVVITPFSDR